jgi:hypothetical protein
VQGNVEVVDKRPSNRVSLDVLVSMRPQGQAALARIPQGKTEIVPRIPAS